MTMYPMYPTATGYDLVVKPQPRHRAVMTAENAAANLLARSGLPMGRYLPARHVALGQSARAHLAEEAAQEREILRVPR